MPTAPGFADVSMELTLTGFSRPAYITYGIDPSETNPVLIAADLYNAWNYAGSVNSVMDSNTTLTGIRVSLGTDGGGDIVASPLYTLVGGAGKSSVPPNCAVLVHKTTARGGRRGRGRLFIPWMLAETEVDEAGIIMAATITTFNAALAVWLGRLNASNMPMVVLHGPGRTPTPAPDVVTQLAADRLISTQRRRLGR